MNAVELESRVKVEFQDEGCAVNQPALVRVLKDGKSVALLEAVICQEKGADGGYHNIVKFKVSEMFDYIP